MAHSGAVDDAIFRHHGIIRGEDLDHMLDMAAAFAFCKLPRGNRVAVITGSGGSAVWMSDILSAQGLELPVLEEELQQRLMALLPSYASAQNPVDGTAQAIHEVGYAKLVEIVRESQRIDTILLIGSLANEATAKQRAEELAAVTGDTEQPIILSTYTTATPGAMAAFAEAGIPCYTSMPSCARAIRALVDYARFQDKRRRRRAVDETPPGLRDEVGRALAAAGPVLTEPEAKTLLARYGVVRPAEALVTSADEAAAAAARIGGPVALKVQSPDITHKTEAGAVALGLSGEVAVRDAYRRVVASAARAHPDAAIQGVMVQAMARPGHEMILGVTRDATFGPMLMVGLGGIHVEVLHDIVFAPVPIGADEALSLLGELKGVALLDGARGAPPADRAALAELMATLSRFAADHADAIEEIDLNPVIVHPQGQGLTVVDALIVKRNHAGDPRMSDVGVSQDGFVATVEMRRPPHNFFDSELIAEIGEAFERLDADPRCRAIVLAAEGRSFCAGADFSKRMETGTVEEGSRSGAGRHLYKEAIRLFRTRKPIVAAVHGRRWAGARPGAWSPISASPARRRASARISIGSGFTPALA